MKAEAGLAGVQLADAPVHFLSLAVVITARIGGFSRGAKHAALLISGTAV